MSLKVVASRSAARSRKRQTETLKQNVNNTLYLRARGSMGHVNMVGNEDILPQDTLAKVKGVEHVAKVEPYMLAMMPTEGALQHESAFAFPRLPGHHAACGKLRVDHPPFELLLCEGEGRLGRNERGEGYRHPAVFARRAVDPALSDDEKFSEFFHCTTLNPWS